MAKLGKSQFILGDTRISGEVTWDFTGAVREVFGKGEAELVGEISALYFDGEKIWDRSSGEPLSSVKETLAERMG